MPFIKQLSEKLEAQKIYDGSLGKYETRFKVDGAEYALLATSVGGDYYDNTQWMLEFENIKSHRIGTLDNNPKVAKAFAEAVDGWVKEKSPMSFYTYGSHIESLQKIIEAVKKKVKKYNLIDPTQDTKTEEGIEVPGNPIGKIVWTKMVEQEAVPTEEREALESDEFETPYEEPKDIKPNKKHMSYKKDDKLDKGEGSYDLKTESVEDVDTYYKKFKDKMKGSSKSTADGWVKGTKLSKEDKNKLRKKLGLPIKKEESFAEFKARRLNEGCDAEEEFGERELDTEQNKNNVLRFFEQAADDMKEIVSTSERNPYDKKIIEMALDYALMSLNQMPAEEFEGLQKYTGDKEPDFMSKQIFKAIQSVVGSEEDSITGGKPVNKAEGKAALEALADSIVEKVKETLKGDFQQSTANLGVKKRKQVAGINVDELPSKEFLQQRMKELGM